MKLTNSKKIVSLFFRMRHPRVYAFIVAIFAIALLITGSVAATAGVPQIINFQGRLLDSSANLLGGSGTNYCFRFSLYDAATSGTKLWPASTPSTMTLSVRQGVFDAGIGDTGAGGDTLNYDFQSNNAVYVNVEVAAQISGSCSGVTFETLTPRQRLESSGYAINSGTVDGFTAAQSASGSQVPALTSDALVLGGASAALRATSTTALTIQGGGATGNIQFFSGSNTLTSGGALTLAGGVTATTFNGNTFTTGTGTLTLAAGKTLTASNTLTLAGTDGSTLNVGTGGTLGSNAFTSTAFAPLASPTFTGTVTIPTPFTLGSTSVTSTGTQLNFLNAATGTTGTTSSNLVFSTSPTITGGTFTTSTVNGVTLTTGGGTTTFLNANGAYSTPAGGTAYTFSTGLTNTANTITDNLATGISGGQSVIGGTAASNNLTLSSTSNATKGTIRFGNSGYDEANQRLGLGTNAPGVTFQIAQSTSGTGTISTTAAGTTVTGTGTQFTNTFKVGDTITANGETHTISAIASSTSMTTDAWTNTNTNVAYTLVGGNKFLVQGNGAVTIPGGAGAPLTIGTTFTANAGGSQYALNINPTVTGDPGGTTTFTASNYSVTAAGTNNIATMSGLLDNVVSNMTSGTIATGTGAFSGVAINNAGNITNAASYQAQAGLNGSGSFTTYKDYAALAPSGAGAGTITTVDGFITSALKTSAVTTAYDFFAGGASDLNYFAGFVGFGLQTPTTVVNIGGNQTASAWGVGGINFAINAATYTDSSSASGTVTNNMVNVIGRPTLAASSTGVTYTNAATLYIANAPANGTNVTVTNPYALDVAAGNSLFGGNVTVSGTTAAAALTATTFNGNTFTAGSGVLTLAAGKTLTASNTLTLAGTDGSTLNVGTGGTLGTAAFTASTAYVAAGANSNITSLTGLTGAISSPTSITFAQTASPSYTRGQLVYDTGNESLTFFNSDSNIGLQVGQEDWIRVTNNSGSTITNGAAVYITGTSGGLPTIALAEANAAATANVIGITTESIANGSTGYVTSFGEVHGLATNGLTAGGALYLSATTPGALTQTAPSAPNIVDTVGYVNVVDPTVGQIMVIPATGITPYTASTGLTLTSNAFSVNTSQNISTLSNLISNGLVTTSGGTGALSVTTMGTGVATFLGTPSSANLASAITDETGSGALVFGTSPTINTPTLSGSTTASSGLAQGTIVSPTLTAAANNDLLIAMDLGSTTFTPGAFTGVKKAAIRLGNDNYIYANNSSGTALQILGYNSTNSLVIGNNTLATSVLGTTITFAGNGVTSLQFQNGGTNFGTMNGVTGDFIFQNGGTVTDDAVHRIQISGGLSIGGTALSAAAWGANGVNFNSGAATYTDSSSTGTVTLNAVNSFGIPTLASTNTAVTDTTAATLYIAGAPTAGTNTTIGTAYALDVASGVAAFNGGITAGAGTGSNFSMSGSSTLNGVQYTDTQLLFGGAADVNTRAFFNGNTNSTLNINDSYSNVIVGSSPIKAASSGTHAWLANMVVNPIGTVTNTSAIPITNTASLYVGGAGSGGTNNYALYVNGGVNNFVQNALGTTTADGLILSNTTAAAVGAQQISPSLHFSSFGWGTTAGTSQSSDWRINTLPTQNTTPTGVIQFQTSTAGSAYTNAMTLTSQGNLSPIGTITTTTTANSFAFTSNATSTSSNFATLSSGYSINTTAALLFAGGSTINYRAFMNGTAAATPATTQPYASFIIGSMPVTIPSTGTTTLFANQVINPLAITTGAGTVTATASLYINGAATPVTGAAVNYALDVADASTAALGTTVANGGGILFNFTGAHTGYGFQLADVTASGTADVINTNSLTTGTAFGINSSATGLTVAATNTGSLFDITESGAMTGMTGSLASINASGANTVGSTGNAFNVNVAGTAQIMKALNVTDATTGALTNGIARFNFTGAHTGNGVEVDDVTTTGTVMQINATALTSGTALSVVAGATGNTNVALISSGATGSTTDLLKLQYTGLATLATTNNFVRFLNSSSVTQGAITGTTVTGNVLYTTTSDARVKHDIEDTHYGLSDLLDLNVRDYVFNADGTNTVQTGFVAQELYKVYPQAVATNGDDGTTPLQPGEEPWSVDYGKVTPLIVKAIQDQQVLLGQFTGKTDNLSTLISDTQAETPHDPVATLAAKISSNTQFLTDFVSLRVTAIRGYFDEIFANKVHSNQICLKKSDGTEICLDGDQLQGIVNGNGTGSTTNSSTYVTPVSSSPSNTSSSSSDTTSDSTSTTQTPVVTPPTVTPTPPPSTTTDTTTSTDTSSDTSTPAATPVVSIPATDPTPAPAVTPTPAAPDTSNSATQ